MSKKRSARRTLLILVAVFAVPYVLAWYFFLNPDVTEKFGTRANGTLINPPIEARQLALKHENGARFPAAAEGERKWMLMMFGGQDCGAECEKTLFTLQQLRRMMAVEKARLRRAYVLLEDDSGDRLGGKLDIYQGTELFMAEPSVAGSLENSMGLEAGTLAQHIVIADPAGYLVMVYPREIEPRKIFADIEILFGRVKGV